MLDHHKGFTSQHCAICACVANKNGVARQCNKHRPLDSTPMESDLLIDKFILSFNATKLQYYYVFFYNATKLHYICIMGITRQTKQVKTLVDVFDNKKTAISVVDLVKLLKSQMNKTTVYRILDKLMDDGIVHSFIGKGGLKWYAKCQDCSCETHNDLHPHFQCKTCGEVECLSVSFALPPISDYKVESANLFMVGVCCNCLKLA